MMFGAQANYASTGGYNRDRGFYNTMDTGIVQHPPGKRIRSLQDMRHAEGAPRAKRRFERISARFENFSISSEPSTPSLGHSMESSSDDDDLVQESMGMREEGNDEHVCSSVVEEPDDDSALTAKRLRLADELSDYLERARDQPILWKRMMEASKVSEGALTIWRPPVPAANPFDDPSMRGRINELSDDDNEIDEDGDVVIDDEIHHVGEISPSVSYPDDPYRESSSTLDSLPSTISSSPVSSPSPDSESGYGNRIVEIADGGTSTDSSLEDDDAMEMD
ncbi:hypothetical protein PFISCL1PPCAC_10766 [Pristionchus fissidentatus]|uniref:Uncharacterized protein n=1 Tax=Pristionchus fissidentatus TaxID=1538716 RepID=A0AAV5VM43_9BILA|nr:hypothetical protein PFISCL1PPCAC_10766 [Pristionchus fissidentatus]